jgi:imidazolonepropionase-like amidohydrolase
MRTYLTITIVLVSFVGAITESLFAAPARPVAIQNVTLIDGTGAPAKPGMTVIVEGGRFTTVNVAKQTKAPPDAEIIDGKGKFAIPGLWDMHVHLTQLTEIAGPALIANGVTGVRDMGGSLELVDWIRQRVADGAVVGPHIFRPGPFVDGSKPGVADRLVVWNAEDGRKAVNFLKDRGVDFIKVHNGAPAEAFFALLKEAAAKHVQVVGHIPFAVDPADAISAGYNGIEHVVSLFEGPVRTRIREGKSQSEAMAAFTDDEARKLAKLMAKNNAWFDPTLVFYWSIAHQAELKEHPDSRDRFVSQSGHEFWKLFPDRPNTPEMRKTLEDAFARFLKIVAIVHSEKVKFLVGTDTGGRDVYPGFSTHDELGLLVKAGLSPGEAIVAATRHPAECLGKISELGTVESGKIADLVLLDQNPLTDIANTKKINAVVANGRLFKKSELDAMTEMVAKEAPNR